LNPGGVIPDPHEWVRNREEPPWNRPDVPYTPPEQGYNSNAWHPDGPGVFPWMTGKPKPDPLDAMTKTELIQFVRDMRRAHAQQWLKMDDEIKHLQALNQTLARQALAAEPDPQPTQKQASTCR
jgi:hypothetical protein